MEFIYPKSIRSVPREAVEAVQAIASKVEQRAGEVEDCPPKVKVSFRKSGLHFGVAGWASLENPHRIHVSVGNLDASDLHMKGRKAAILRHYVPTFFLHKLAHIITWRRRNAFWRALGPKWLQSQEARERWDGHGKQFYESAFNLFEKFLPRETLPFALVGEMAYKPMGAMRRAKQLVFDYRIDVLEVQHAEKMIGFEIGRTKTGRRFQEWMAMATFDWTSAKEQRAAHDAYRRSQ